MTRELKVGATFLVGMFILFYLLSVGGVRFLRFYSPQRELAVVFDNVSGLKRGSPVFMLGVEVGEVKGIRLKEGKVWVEVLVDRGLFVPADSTAVIGLSSLLGERFLEIRPGSSSEPLERGVPIRGSSSKGLEEVSVALEESLEEVKRTFAHLNDVLGSEDVKLAISRFVRDLPRISDSMAGLARNLEELSSSLSGDVRELKEELLRTMSSVRRAADALGQAASGYGRLAEENRSSVRELLSSLERSVYRLRTVISEFDRDGRAGAELREAVGKVREAASSIKNLAERASALLEGDGFASDLRGAVAGVRRVVELGKGFDSSLKVGIRVDEGALRGDAWFDWRYRDQLYGRVGFWGLGGSDSLEFTLGKRLARGFGLCLGSVGGELAGGVDFDLSSRARVNLRLVRDRARDYHLDAMLGWGLGEGVGFYLRSEGIDGEEGRFGAGLYWSF